LIVDDSSWTFARLASSSSWEALFFFLSTSYKFVIDYLTLSNLSGLGNKFFQDFLEILGLEAVDPARTVQILDG
jgi:hypothetical protein